MNDIATLWVVVYLCSTLLFFGTAAIIIVFGTRDLRDLLRSSSQKGPEVER